MKPAVVSGLALALAFSCHSRGKHRNDDSTRQSSFAFSQLIPSKTDGPPWQRFKVELVPQGSGTALTREYPLSAFARSKLNDVTVRVEYGLYLIVLSYFDDKDKLLYTSCADEKKREHRIEIPNYETTIKVCALDSDAAAGEVKVTPSSRVSITPTLQEEGALSGADPNLVPANCQAADGAIKVGFDAVFGQCIEQSSSWTVQNGEIFRQGKNFSLKGINWFGLDSADNKLAGLWTGRKISEFLDQVKSLGFNALRIPLSPATLTASDGTDGYATPRKQLEALLTEAESRQIAVLLDMHTCARSAGHTTGTPAHAASCPGATKASWIHDLKQLAELSRSYSYVVGIDLYNEPYALSWSQWRDWASEAAAAVLAVNPRILVFVEGVASAAGTSYGRYGPFWGENLYEAVSKPLSIPASRLVYSPHTYGPGVYAGHDYFNSPSFPSNMPEVWDEHFGYLRDQGAALAIGEFGGRYVGSDKLWQDRFVQYLRDKKIKHFFYWSLNPNSGDTGGLLKDDWKTVNQEKYNLLKPLLGL